MLHTADIGSKSTPNRQSSPSSACPDPEGNGAPARCAAVGYYTDDGKLIYAGCAGMKMPDKVLADLILESIKLRLPAGHPSRFVLTDADENGVAKPRRRSRSNA
jgi:hypothetical protein